jgi:hypothetical protein
VKAPVVGILFASVFSSGCAGNQPLPTSPEPQWLAALIFNLEHPPVSNPPSVIARYEFHDKLVYYVAPRCCDIRGVLYDSAGNILCEPDSGITGAGDGRCPDFFAQRRSERIVWRPPGSS